MRVHALDQLEQVDPLFLATSVRLDEPKFEFQNVVVTPAIYW
jgi:hypothetical protein